ncbi:MAG: N-formylglutamate amidohydrolase [Crocinitomicaceae bacterium]|nr:N-formylglutamate amidohydrolase [Crocinitomicaceae bacterium]
MQNLMNPLAMTATDTEKIKLILHIPHSSDKVPDRKAYVINKKRLDNEILKLTDWYTDDLFSFENGIPIRADFSRVFCDVERFSDDAQEPMSKFGMGVLYEKMDDGSALRVVPKTLRENILNHFYWPHHEKLNQAVEKQLKLHGKAIIIDCHSFPSKPLNCSLDPKSDRPDFNIGTDSYHTPDYLIQLSKTFFQKKGYSLGVDWPYNGSLVPLSHYKKTKNVESIMLEVNRALYLNEPGNSLSANYSTIKKVISEYLALIKMEHEKSINPVTF